MNAEQRWINFNYQNEMIDGKEVVCFILETFPTVKFRYNNIRFGTPDEDNMVNVMFDLDVAHLKDIDETQLGEEFNSQVKGLLSYLLQSANNRAVNIINDPETKGLTTQDSPAIMPLTGQDETGQEEKRQEEKRQDK